MSIKGWTCSFLCDVEVSGRHSKACIQHSAAEQTTAPLQVEDVKRPPKTYQSADPNIPRAPMGVLVNHECQPPEVWHADPGWDPAKKAAGHGFPDWQWCCPHCHRLFRLNGFGSTDQKQWSLKWIEVMT